MATVSHADPKRKYSWWWDSHISPKNSKWLQENLTDMDAKVKQMIKLIEEDADSFARRAEMYYKKRPELMKLVEEFYRAYRALAERYDHATGALRQAHRTMAEAFPNQIPLVFADDSPAGLSSLEGDPRTPEMPTPVRALLDPDELQKDALGLSSFHFHAVKRNGAFTEEPDSVVTRKGLKQLNDLLGPGEAVSHSKLADGRVRKGLNFHDAEEPGRNLENNTNHEIVARVLSESERVGRAETEIIALKNALAKLEAEKEASLLQYQQSLERLSKLETEVSHAQEDSRGLHERASKAEAEVQTLKGTLTKFEAERKATLLQYQQCLEKITTLENSISHAQRDAGELNERATRAESDNQAIKQELARVEAEKETTLHQYKKCLEIISTLEDKLLHAEEDARKINERAEKAEGEIETLKQALSSLTEEKEASALQYQQCLETIAKLEHKLACAQEEAQRLNREIDDGVAKLKGAEERCLLLERSNETLHSELESLAQKMGSQSQDLTEKQKELGRLWTCIQEERLRFMEAETAFQTLQHLHSQSQEELRTLAMELQSRAQMLENMETRNQDLHDEVQKVKEENKSLNELNFSSAVSIKDLQDEILSLKETINKLEAEVELRVDQRNALQQEIYCLKEELNDLSKKHQAVMNQVESVGLDPDFFGSSVKELQDENSKLKEFRERERSEKLALMEKLEVMEKLVEKNALLENSVSDLNVELEEMRGRVKALEESCHCLLAEKSILVAEKEALISQLHIATENLEKLSDKKSFLENSLFDANAELEGLRVRLKSLEDSCLSLDKEKSGLVTEREGLASRLDITQKSLEDLERGYTGLEGKCLALEEERESTIRKIEELRVLLEAKNQEYASFAQLSATRITDMELMICSLEEESKYRKKEHEEELDKAINAQIEIFILQKCIQDLEEQNFFLFVKCQRLKEVSKLSDKVISDLQCANGAKQFEIKSLFGQIQMLRIGLGQVSKRLDVDAEPGVEDKTLSDQTVLDNILCKLQEMQSSLVNIQDQYQQSAIENVVLVALLRQLKLEAADLATERNILDQELKIQYEQFLSLQIENQKLTEINEELRLKAIEGGYKEEALKSEIENFHRQLLDLQGTCKKLQEENCKIVNEKGSLKKSVMYLEEEKHNLEEESFFMLAEIMFRSSLSLIYKDILSEKAEEIKELSESLVKLHSINNELEEKTRKMDCQLKDVWMENSQLKGSLEISGNELFSVRSVCDQLTCDVANGKNLLCQREKELCEVEQMLTAVQNEKTDLQKMIDGLKCQYDDVKVIKEDQEREILKLSGDYDHQSKEIRCIREVNEKLEGELLKLNAELEEVKREEERLSYELLKERNEGQLWETQAAELVSELQISTVLEALLEGKTSDLLKACENIERRSTSKDMENDLLKERVSTLEDENRGLKAQLATYTPAIISLKHGITSLENHSLLQAQLYKFDHKETKDANLVSDLPCESHLQTSEGQVSLLPNGFSDLQDLEMRIKTIEKAVTETERLAVVENLNSNSLLEAAMRQIEELKSASSLRQVNLQTSKHVNLRQQERLGSGHCNDRKQQKQTLEISEEGNEVMKDIMLDQISECSSYGISRRETVEVDDHMLELWETTSKNGSIDLKVNGRKVASEPTEVCKEQKRKIPSEESLIEKELGIDKLEISKRFTELRQEGSKRRILERLDSDAQKLTNLQITVQDLKRKVEITEKSKKGKGIEYDTVKGQLEEAEKAIMKLFDVNRKLMVHAEDGSLSCDSTSAELDESGNVRRRKIAQQAQRGSEKIGRLQLEVQKIQFLLLKLDDEKESRGKAKIPEHKTRVLLRDYLYSGGRSSQKRKKAPFCSCVQPPTKGD